MTNEEITKKIEQEAEKYAFGTPIVGSDRYEEAKAFKAGANFVLETILPELLEQEKRNSYEAGVVAGYVTSSNEEPITNAFKSYSTPLPNNKEVKH